LGNDIKNVIENGKKIMSYPVLANYVAIDAEPCNTTKIAISVAKRNFKKAVDRNLLKRRIREAYRQNKHNLNNIAQKNNKTINIIIIYVPKEKLSYREIEKGIAKLLENIANNIEKNNNLSSDIAD
jgi:ribonuclease P protein component